MRLKKLYLGGKLLDLPHPFEEELDCLVSINHRLLMENISRLEQEATVTGDGFDLIEVRGISDELRRAANNLAVVGLVTRFHHWISLFVEELTQNSVRDEPLVRNLRALEGKTGEGPISISFFQELVTVRDSIIHADSRTEWVFGNKRNVAERYANVSSGEVEFTNEHLKEAIEKSVMQVKWYDERLDLLQPVTP